MANHIDKQTSEFKYHDFEKIWKFFPVRRPMKESVKNLLFSWFPVFFKKWEIYQNWKYARVYQNRKLKWWHLKFWERKFFTQYTINLKTNYKTPEETPLANKLAVVVHAFYTDIFYEIYEALQRVENIELSLYLTGPEKILDEIKTGISSNPLPVQYFPVKNHGRDILPFLTVLPKVFEDGHTIILKLHTKKSNHLNRRDLWCNDLISKLAGKGCVNRVMEVFGANPSIGMVGPIGNIMPMSLYYAANGQRVNEIAQKMGISNRKLEDMNFVAGSMFYARKEALLPVLKLNLSDTDFEAEDGQKDGTMAHAIERIFAASLLGAGLQFADTNFSPHKPVLTVSKINKFII